MVIVFQRLHNVGRRPLVHQLIFHEVHIRSHVIEELIVPLAEIIQSRFPLRRAAEPVFRTFAVAGKEILLSLIHI